MGGFKHGDKAGEGKEVKIGKNNKLNSIGEYIYKGKFKKDVFHGEGTLETAREGKIEGIFKNGRYLRPKNAILESNYLSVN